MSRSHAIIALTALVVVFALGLVDYAAPPYGTFLPEALVKVVSAVLIGVTIGLILSGLRRNGANTSNPPDEHPWDDRDRPSMRQGLDYQDPGRTDPTQHGDN